MPGPGGQEVLELDGTVILRAERMLRHEEVLSLFARMARLFPGRRVGVMEEGNLFLLVRQSAEERDQEGDGREEQGSAGDPAGEEVARAGVSPADGLSGTETADPSVEVAAAAGAGENGFDVYLLRALRRVTILEEDPNLGLAGFAGAEAPGGDDLGGEVEAAGGAERVGWPVGAAKVVPGFGEGSVLRAQTKEPAVDASNHLIGLLRRLRRRGADSTGGAR